MKIATFNVNSLKVRLPVVLAWLAKHQPDVLALQEVDQAPDDFSTPRVGVRLVDRDVRRFDHGAVREHDLHALDASARRTVSARFGRGSESWPRHGRRVYCHDPIWHTATGVGSLRHVPAPVRYH